MTGTGDIDEEANPAQLAVNLSPHPGASTVDCDGFAQPKRPPWLLLVYMSASAPNLQQPLGLDLKELARPLREFGSDASKHVHVVVQIDTPTGVSKRFRLCPKGSDPIPRAKGIWPTKAATTLLDFITEESRGYTHRALVVWGHASGVGRGVERPGLFISADRAFVPPRPVEAGAVWSQIRCIDPADRPHLIGFDACHMGSVEVACELAVPQSCAGQRLMLAPQADIGLEGWHYDMLLDNILAYAKGCQKPEDKLPRVIDPLKLGRAVVQQVGLSASSPEGLTLVDLKQVGALVQCLKSLVLQITRTYRNLDREAQARRLIQDVFHDTAWAKVRQFLDLADLCRHLASRMPYASIRAAAEKTLSTLSGRKVIVDQFTTLDVPVAGLSIYCPWPRATARLTRLGVRNVQVDQREYERLAFSKATWPVDDWSGKFPMPQEENGCGECDDLPLKGCEPQSGWSELIFDPVAVQDAERRWVRNETRDRVGEFAQALSAGRVDGPKPAERGPGPKPAERASGPKPAGRGDDVVERWDDPWEF